MTRRTLTREEIEEQDFQNLVAASGSEVEESDFDDDEGAGGESKKDKKKKMKERKEKLRNLLLAGGDDEDGVTDVWGKAGTAWANELEDIKSAALKDRSKSASKKAKKGGDLEITFRPGLSVAKGDGGEENMTSLERYQLRMKEKKQRKKEKMELKAAARERGDEEKTDGQDEFFGSDSSEEEEEQQPKPKSKPKSLEPTLPDEDDLAAIVGTNEPDSNFSMKDIIKTEKEAGKKRRRRKGKKGEQERDVELGPDDWKIDAKDDRFKALHEEPEFAIDPSNPQ